MVSGIRSYLFEEGIMNPVVGIDVSKEESEGFIFLERNKSLGKSFRFLHTFDGIQSLISRLQEVESLTERRPVIVLNRQDIIIWGL